MDSRQPPIGDGDWTAAFGRRYTLTHFDDVLTVNKERAAHWSVRSPVVARWREAYGWLAHATNVPTDGTLGACHIDAVPLVRGRRRQDVAACLPVVKAAIDGLVDVGELERVHLGVLVVRCHLGLRLLSRASLDEDDSANSNASASSFEANAIEHSAQV